MRNRIQQSLTGLCAASLLAGSLALAGTPTVSNIQVQQLAGTEQVQISYDLAESEGLACWISISADRDNNDTWVVPMHSLSGDVGPGILPGHHQVLWNAGADYDDHISPNTRVHIIAHSLVDGVPEHMVLVPAGEFVMGCEEVCDGYASNSSMQPEHTVYLDAYWIEKYEVTNAQYKLFCDETSRSYPPDPGFAEMSEYFLNYPDFPVMKVTWYDAQAYAQWSGKRLPTEAEWEKASRSADLRCWPWGDTSDQGNANVNGVSEQDAWQYSCPVSSFSHAPSPYGCLNMAGNVWEWCQDSFDPAYYLVSPPMNPVCNTGTSKVLRGGSFSAGVSSTRCSVRESTDPANTSPHIGFRCCRSIE